jgi:hypothetical protein
VIAEWIADHFRTCIVLLALAVGLSFWLVVRGDDRLRRDRCGRPARGTVTHQAPAPGRAACVPPPREPVSDGAAPRRTDGGPAGGKPGQRLDQQHLVERGDRSTAAPAALFAGGRNPARVGARMPTRPDLLTVGGSHEAHFSV